MQKIILYYLFTPLNDPEVVLLWQKALAERFNLKGRIIISNQGINGTLGGEIEDLKQYIKQTKVYSGFSGIEFKWSDGSREDFPRLSIKLRDELVSFKVADQIEVNSQGIIGGGKKITPKKLHELVALNPDQVVFVDGRNKKEAAIGKFKNAVVMDVDHSRDFPKAIKSDNYNFLKNKKVVTYCTGGIRCEVLSKLMIDAGYQEVYQLDGGIVKYLESYKDKGLWEGSLFVFDQRMSIKASNEVKTIGECSHCFAKTDNYVNCANKSCNELILLCLDCAQESSKCAVCLKSVVV